MAPSDGNEPDQLQKSRVTNITIKPSKIPRRRLTLLSITILLNVLLWSSVLVLISSLYLIASDLNDSTNIPTELLTITSAFVSIGYVVVHTVFSHKQRIWKHQCRDPAIIRKTTYIAVRLGVTLCIFWLFTSGWNLITVARRPICLPDTPGLAGWESGTPCLVGRVGIALSLVALIASGTIFGILATVRRPFEAHVFKHGLREPIRSYPTPAGSRRPSLTRSASFTSEKYHARMSVSTHRTRPSIGSNTDVDSFVPLAIHAPSPTRSLGMGIFTSDAQPPPLPACYVSLQNTRLEPLLLPPIFQPSISSPSLLLLPPRVSALAPPSGFMPLSRPAQYSASAWRAVYPPLPPSAFVASRSHPHLPHSASAHSLPYRTRYSRSSVSLTRPHRLSVVTPAGSVGWSSRSSSTAPGQEHGSPERRSSAERTRVSPKQTSYAFQNGTAVVGIGNPKTPNHARHASAPDAITGAERSERMAKGWRPQLHAQIPRKPLSIVRSSSVEAVSKVNPDSNLDVNDTHLHDQLEKEITLRLGLTSTSSQPNLRKLRSESPLHSQANERGGASGNARTSPMPQAPVMVKRGSRGSLAVGEGKDEA